MDNIIIIIINNILNGSNPDRVYLLLLIIPALLAQIKGVEDSDPDILMVRIRIRFFMDNFFNGVLYPYRIWIQPFFSWILFFSKGRIRIKFSS